MRIDLASKQQVAAKAVATMGQLGTIPEVTQRLLALANDPKSNAADFNRVIMTDPALSARVLRIVNSSLYGFPGQISSINRAIVMLGVNAIRNLALSASFAKVFQGPAIHALFNPAALWLHSARTAVAAKALSDHLRLSVGDEAFLAGLIHDVGFVVLAQTQAVGLGLVFDEVSGCLRRGAQFDVLEIEQRILDTDHGLVGAALCAHWKFPVTLSAVAEGHHVPSEVAPVHQRLAALIHVAERVGETFDGPFHSDLSTLEIGIDVMDMLRIKPDQVGPMREAVAASLGAATLLAA